MRTEGLPALSWAAPPATGPITASVAIPGSKSETNRTLVLAALATGPSQVTAGLDARDTTLMRDALRQLGVVITESVGGDRRARWTVTPPERFSAGGRVDCGLAGTVMRFVPPVAALAAGAVHFDGDEQAYARPMGVILEALVALGARIEDQALRLPFTLLGDPGLPGGVVTIDASTSSQFVSGLLLAGARYRHGLDLRHDGKQLPSLPHIDMTVAMLRDRGVAVDDAEPHRWVVSPGPIAPADVSIEPDLSNAAPFLAAGPITGGAVTVPGWPRRTNQPGDHIRDILQQFGAAATLADGDLTVRGGGRLRGVDLDLHEASELTPVVAALAALADGTSRLRGVAHIRGHETDRLAALETELNRLGGDVRQTEDGLEIRPRPLHGGLWHAYADHRLAQAGALLGLLIAGVQVDDIACTHKTMPEFADLWRWMVEGPPSPAERVPGS